VRTLSDFVKFDFFHIIPVVCRVIANIIPAKCALIAHHPTILLGFLIFQLKVNLEMGIKLQGVLR